MAFILRIVPKEVDPHVVLLFSCLGVVLIFLIFMQVPWIQVSRSRALLLMVKPAVFLVAVGMGAYVLSNYLVLHIKLLVSLMLIVMIGFLLLVLVFSSLHMLESLVSWIRHKKTIPSFVLRYH